MLNLFASVSNASLKKIIHPLATQNCRQTWSPFYHDGRRFVTGLITSLPIHFSYPPIKASPVWERPPSSTHSSQPSSPGFGDYVNNCDSWSPIVDFIDDQHEACMIQEEQPQRSGKSDLCVHASYTLSGLPAVRTLFIYFIRSHLTLL